MTDTNPPHAPKPAAPAPPPRGTLAPLGAEAPRAPPVAATPAPTAAPKPASAAAPAAGAPAPAKPAEPALPPQPAAAGEAKRSPEGSAPPIDISEVDALKALVGDAVVETGRQTDKPVAVVATPRILDALRAARDELKYDHLANYTATDYPLKKQIEVTYNLWSYAKHKHLVLKTRLPRDNAVAPSLTALWAGANWDERELFDLMGITFTGHPHLRRLFLPDNWKGHPLRKDYPLQEEQWIGMDAKGEDVAYQTPGDDRW